MNNILLDINTLLSPLNIPIETGVFKDKAPDTYIVLIPLVDSYPLFTDDKPVIDYQELRITIFTKANYMRVKEKICKLLLQNDFDINERVFNGYDTETGYNQYSIEIAKLYDIEEDN